jgi:hypothetical protein
MSSGIVYRPRPDATAEGELRCLAEIYKFILFDSQAKRGDPHDLMNGPTTEMTKNGKRKERKPRRISPSWREHENPR